MRENTINSEGLWYIQAKYGFLGLPRGEGFCIVRAKNEILSQSHTSLMQFRKRVSGLGFVQL